VNLGKVSNAIHYRDGDGKFTEKVVLTGELNEQDLANFATSMVQSIVSGLEDRFPEGDLRGICWTTVRSLMLHRTRASQQRRL
jgi:hypothetical protein